jgi:hypothetical protein
MARQIIPNSGFWSTLAALINVNFQQLFDAHQMVQISITHPDPEILIAVTGTGNAGLNPADGGYVQILNAYTQVLNKGSAFTVQPDGRLLINKTGLIKLTGYLDATHSANNATNGVSFTLERNSVVNYTPRAVHLRMPNAGDIGHLAGVGIVDAQVGDILGVAIASNITGNISLRTSSVVAEYHGELN